MMNFVSGRSLRLGEKVECYFNSKKRTVSVRSLCVENKDYLKIVAYAEYVHLENVTFSYNADNNRKIIKGVYSGTIPVLPSNDHMLFYDDGFYSIRNEEVVAAKYAVCYLDMILAENTIKRGAENNGPVHQKRVL